jgi:hypothetical protein
METVEKLQHDAGTIATNLEEQFTNALNEDKKWEDIKAKLAKLSTKGIVILNVGGDKYTTSVDILTRKKDTFFAAFFFKK